MPSLDPFFRPRSIAVVGASRRPNTIGFQIVDNLLRHGYTGVIYPVNPHATAVHSIGAYPSVGAIPGEVELAVVVVPKDLDRAAADALRAYADIAGEAPAEGKRGRRHAQ